METCHPSPCETNSRYLHLERPFAFVCPVSTVRLSWAELGCRRAGMSLERPARVRPASVASTDGVAILVRELALIEPNVPLPATFLTATARQDSQAILTATAAVESYRVRMATNFAKWHRIHFINFAFAIKQ